MDCGAIVNLHKLKVTRIDYIIITVFLLGTIAYAKQRIQGPEIMDKIYVI